ncbi:MAG TPA: YicC/YloC family endoribonuclease [Candidatus Limnocylindrales bacterium]|nr:YicC/YloC family endoribonuclease [Candidatus Limnocylindrales bacterium]
MSGSRPQSAAVPPKQHPAELKSMTGYAQARIIENGWSLRVSVRSVNHRFLDLHLRVPDGFEPVEPAIRQLIRERIRRGHLDVSVHYELEGPAAIGVNQEVAAAYLEAANSLRSKFGLISEPDIASILRLPGVIGPAAASLEEEMVKLESAVSRCLLEALDKLDRMREREASHLRDEMLSRLQNIAGLALRVEQLAERARPAFAKRLETRVRELVDELQLDPARLAQEAAIAAERSDVSEELARLRSHVQQFESLLAGGADVGKKLDFLLQEMQRETNTLLSKTPGNDSEGLEITQGGLEIKSEIEKLREQVQNIE